MLAAWRHSYANLALTGGNLVFLLIAFNLPTPAGYAISAGLVGLTSLSAWYLNLRRYRLVADTPTSRVSSAPQGYIELVGQGRHQPGDQLKSHLTHLPCLWYRYKIEQIGSDNKWRHLESGESDDTFGLDDGTGMMLVDPADAEIITSQKQTWRKETYQFTEWTLIQGRTLYVLGEHTTLGGAAESLNARQDVSDLLADWKRDRKGLLKRFDNNGDGEIDLEEWEQARRAAQHEIAAIHRDLRARDGIHIIRKARGRMFLIADRSPESLASRYRIWAWIHLGLLLGACAIFSSYFFG